MKTYFVLSQNEGSHVYFDKVTEDELLKRLNENYWGENVKFLKDLPESQDGCFFEEGVLIIEGKAIVPKAVQTVTEYKL